MTPRLPPPPTQGVTETSLSHRFLGNEPGGEADRLEKPVIREGPGNPLEDVTLVIPSRNEAGAIAQVVREWWGSRPPGIKTEILVVDDGSTDATPEILRELQREIPLRVVRNTRSLGYGESLKIGVRQTRTPWVAFTDGDGQYDPRDLPTLLNLVRIGNDMAIGIRTPRQDPFLRKVVSRVFRLFLSVFFVLRAQDPTVALRVGRTEVVRFISEQTRYMNGAFLNEFMVRLDQGGYRYAEAPIRHRARRWGESKNVPHWLLPKVSVQQIIALVRLWREFHRLGVDRSASAPLSTESP
ncbi:MAG: glycosyltransferase family 2 protein [Thermoplasmata archaeon]|nr:glycosyltransferase family 2 protein [Thermoplasmata archaeon]